MESLFLTRDELIELTGYRQRARQIEWLRSRGCRADRNAAGAVLVLRDHVRTVFGAPATAQPAQEPDLSALDGGGR